MGQITVTREGRRSYLRGDTYAAKDAIRAAGGHWDRDAKAWWLGDHARAEALATAAQATAAVVETARAEARAAGVCSWTKSGDAWVVRSPVAITAGQTVTVRKASGETQQVTVTAVTDCTDTATGTGCRCGSVEEYARASDCASCRHDRD